MRDDGKLPLQLRTVFPLHGLADATQTQRLQSRFLIRVLAIGRPNLLDLHSAHEASPSAGSISFQSPLGKALMKRKVGDVVTVLRPAGEIEIEIKAIRYE